MINPAVLDQLLLDLNQQHDDEEHLSREERRRLRCRRRAEKRVVKVRAGDVRVKDDA
jgi:hypothetical protein